MKNSTLVMRTMVGDLMRLVLRFRFSAPSSDGGLLQVCLLANIRSCRINGPGAVVNSTNWRGGR